MNMPLTFDDRLDARIADLDEKITQAKLYLKKLKAYRRHLTKIQSELVAIAESGQKYVLPWAPEATDKTLYPVQFELDTLWVDHGKFSALLTNIEGLQTAGFSKTEILSGLPRSENLMKSLDQWLSLYPKVEPYLGTRLLELTLYVSSATTGTDDTPST